MFPGVRGVRPGGQQAGGGGGRPPGEVVVVVGEEVAALQEVARDVQLLGTKCDSLNQQLDDVQEKM